MRRVGNKKNQGANDFVHHAEGSRRDHNSAWIVTLLHLNTDCLRPQERLPSWGTMLHRVCGGFEVEADGARDFTGEIFLERFGGIDCASVAGNQARIVRDRLTADSEGSGLLFYVLQVEGASRMRQGEGEALLHPGDATLIDGGLSSEFLYDSYSRQLSLHLPARVVAAYGRGRRPRTAITIAGRGYAGALHALLIRSLSEAGTFSLEDGALVRAQLLEGVLHLILAEEGTPAPANPSRRDAWDRVHSLLEQQLSDANLDCAAAARYACVSVRQLQRLFQSRGLTFSAWLRRERLERCYFDLRQASGTRPTVTEVAFRWGFNDPAYFSRVFSAQFGFSPREARHLPSPIGSAGQVSGAPVQAQVS